MSGDPIRLAAERWYGYGLWAAPYWFIGPEPGMKKAEGDNLRERCEAWLRLGGGELVDCAAHHRAFHHSRYHDRTIPMKMPVNEQTMRPPLQDTWRQLIRLLLAFKGDRTDNDAVGDYQCDKWGSATGETCVAELSSLAARSLSVERDRDSYRLNRVQHLRERAVEMHPQFVVLYGRGRTELPNWNYIADGRTTGEGFAPLTMGTLRVGFAKRNGTVFVQTEHPVKTGAAAPPDEYWIIVAEKLRDMVTPRDSRG